jgi:hypothetical protein
MKLVKPEINITQVLKLATSGAGACLFVASSVQAVELTNHTSKENLAFPHSIQIAQNKKIFLCPQGKERILAIETTNYKLNICGFEGIPSHYAAVAKNKRQGGITLPLKNYDEQGFRYVAVNGDTTYTLTEKQLTISRGKNIIARERVIAHD